MSQAQTKDPSTLASLSPVESRETHYRSYRSSLRLHGSHFMTLKRPSRTPESGREYVPGDPLNLIDWKAYARTDQLIIREVRDESTARIRIGLDVSETMCWPIPGEPLPTPPVTKTEVAVRVAFNLAHMHLRMGDLVEIWLIQNEKQTLPEQRFMPRSPADLVSAFNRIEIGQFGGKVAFADFALHPYVEREVDAVFWVGDGLSLADFDAFLSQGRRSMMLHVLSSLELDIAWTDNATSYFDEGVSRREYQGQVLRQDGNYAKHLAAWQQKLKSRQQMRGGDYVTLTDMTKVALFHQTLAAFIQERA